MAVHTGTPVADWIEPMALVADPYPAHERLRAESPVAFVPFLQALVASPGLAS